MILPHGKDSSKQEIISSDKAAELVEKGWHKADLHVHTCCSYDVLSAESMHPEKLLQKGRARGLDYITFTDHDTVKAHDIMGWERENLIPGVELSVTDTLNVGHTVHINVFGFEREQYSEFQAMANQENDIYSLIDYFKSNDLPYIYNHPFWFPRGDIPNVPAIPELVRNFPVIEYNMQSLDQKNLLTMELAQKYGKGIAVTTDSHTGSIGKAYTIAKGDTFRDYFSNITKGRSCMVIDQPVLKHITGELDSWIELAFSMGKDIREEVGFTTGMRPFDRLLRFLGSDLLERNPRINNGTRSLLHHISGSGLPALMYMLSKQPHISRISRLINA
jgi:predicted metal-dependent phosphoesterase TrpH